MNEVSALPKLGNNQRSSTAGHLANFQGSTSEQLMRIIGRLQTNVKSISDQTNTQLAERMTKFRSQYDKTIADSREIIDSITTTEKSFDDLRIQLKEIGEVLLCEIDVLKKDCVEIYSQSFKNIKPFVDHAYMISKEILPQVPPNISERLPSEVARLNSVFLKTKQELTKALFQVETNTRSSIQSCSSEFEQRKDKWKDHRFATLIENAKEQLDPTKFVDFGDLYNHFHSEQANFTLCFRKLLNDVTLFVPPDHFDEEPFENWSKEVDDVVECHNNFLKIFEEKFTNTVTNKMNANNKLVSQLELELVELKNENEANSALAEIYPLFKSSQKLNSMLLEKIQKYWEHRRECIKKSFNSVRTFLKPLISLVLKFSIEMKNLQNKENQTTEEIKTKSNETLKELESKLLTTQEEISTMVTEKDINEHVEQCRKNLRQIEEEYHNIYKRLVDHYDKYPIDVGTLFGKIETSILDHIQLKKIDGIALPSVRASDSRGSIKRAPVRKKNSTRVSKAKPIIIEGAKFEEIDPLVLIPPFDDFIDEPVVVPTKGRGTRAKKPVRGKPPAKSSRFANKKDDVDDYEVPDFALVDVVPKINDMVSICIYAPAAEDIAEWQVELRTQVVKLLYSDLNKALIWANDDKKRTELSDELNERMRVHMPRMSAIELNVAETRKLQIQSRQSQLESFFRRTGSHFNSNLSSLQLNLEKLSKEMTNECSNLKNFLEELSKTKSTPGFSILNQNKSIAEHNFSTHFESSTNQQMKEVDDFIVFFTQINQRFQENVFMKDDTYSNEEREMASRYFERMKEQMDHIHQDLVTTVTHNKEKIETQRNQILAEYDNALPNHKADVALIEAIVSLNQEYKQKYESLLFHNHAMEMELQHSIDVVKKSISDDSRVSERHQKVVDKIFASLEELRQKMIDRGIFLKQLKSKISVDKIKYHLKMSGDNTSSSLKDDNGADINNNNNNGGTSGGGKKTSRPSSRSGGRKSRSKSTSSKSGSNKKSSRSSSKRSTSVVLPVEKSTNPLTLEGRLEQLRQDFLNQCVKLATEYYGTFKTRKFPITRPLQIPPTQQEIIDQMNEKWENLTKGFPNVTKLSNTTYRYHVTVSTDITRDVKNTLFEIFSDFFITEAISAREKVQQNFSADLNVLTKERNQNRQKLNMKTADENNSEEFNALYLNEEERNKKEQQLIKTFEISFVECERSSMNNFISRLPQMVQNSLSMLDKFVIVEDLSSGNITENEVTRKTMKELLKEKQRAVNSGGITSSNRPFRQRDWPTLNSVMQPLILLQNIVTPPQDPVSTPDSKKGRSKRGAKNRLDKNDNKSQTSQKIGDEMEKLPVANSLETPLHRTVIIARNVCYNQYESELDKRVTQMKDYINSLQQENSGYQNFWEKSVLELKPKFVKPEIVPVVNKKKK